MKTVLEAPPGFSLHRTIYSHGWSSLPPFRVDKDRAMLLRADALPDGRAVTYSIHQPAKKQIVVEIVNGSANRSEDMKTIAAIVRSSLRFDEDFTLFYSQARKLWHFKWVWHSGAGRLLRAPTVFEDAVKMICTTNCSWALTEVMIANLCKKLGKQMSEDVYTFPTPTALADCTEAFIRKEIRAGYRAPYLLELAKNIVKKKVDIESWRTSKLPTEKLFQEVLSVKGIGPYAAANILKLLGRYDYLGIDSWCRKSFSKMYKNGRKVSDKTIEKYYSQYGEWRGLFFWLDVTKHWYDEKFPF
jgi:N-glycosylase/DNA lyase